MENQEKYEPVLPVEFAHLEEDLKIAREKINEIDAQLEKLPPDRGYRPGHRPPNHGDPATDQYGNRNQLENQKSEIRKDFSEKIEPQLSNADPKLAGKVRNSVDVHLGDNAFKNMTKKDLNEAKDKPKSIDYSQDFLNKRLANYHATINRDDPEDPTEPGASKTKNKDIDFDKN